MNSYLFSDIEVGLSAEFTKTVTVEMEESFRQITGDENPLHRDDEFARQSGVVKTERHVVFGMLTASFYSTLAGVYLPGKYSLIHSLDELSFLKPVFAGDVLNITGQVIEKIDSLRLIIVKAAIRNQDGKLVSKAKIKIIVTK